MKFLVAGKVVQVDDLELTLGSSSAICAAGLARLMTRWLSRLRCAPNPYGDFCTGALRRAGGYVSRVLRMHPGSAALIVTGEGTD